MNNPNITWNADRNFGLWMQDEGISITVSSYQTHQVYTIGLNDTNNVTIWYSSLARVMGLHYNKTLKSLVCSNIGNIIRFENKGKWKTQYGEFDANFVPKTTYHSADTDVHDVCQTNDGEIYYCSALFSCICQPHPSKSFKVYWMPPWIDKLAAEDRCHLNGLCLVDDKPRYVTSTCQGNTSGSWKDIKGKGVVYDIVENKVVCENLINPHSPRWHKGKLWLLESGTGYFGYVDLEKKKFVQCCFIPTFLRGMSLNGDFAIVCGSYDRHDSAFGDLPLGKALQEKGLTSKCGIWIINTERCDICHYLYFENPVKELYDVTVIDAKRARVLELNDPVLFNKFFL
jgi:uncharacterized protein (TIGR03032 family)